jgi:hypothetical protein
MHLGLGVQLPAGCSQNGWGGLGEKIEFLEKISRTYDEASNSAAVELVDASRILHQEIQTNASLRKGNL